MDKGTLGIIAIIIIVIGFTNIDKIKELINKYKSIKTSNNNKGKLTKIQLECVRSTRIKELQVEEQEILNKMEDRNKDLKDELEQVQVALELLER